MKLQGFPLILESCFEYFCTNKRKIKSSVDKPYKSAIIVGYNYFYSLCCNAPGMAKACSTLTINILEEFLGFGFYIGSAKRINSNAFCAPI